jgi:outer membrane protein assembly factor BamB
MFFLSERGRGTCLDAATGAVVWQQEQFMYHEGLCAGDDGIIVQAAADPQRPTHVLAFDAATGQPRWHTELADSGECLKIASAGDVVCVLSRSAKRKLARRRTWLYVLDASTGHLLWREAHKPFPDRVHRALLGVTAGTVCFTDPDGTVHARDARTGSRRWSTPSRELTVTGGLAFVTTYNANRSRLDAIEPTTGTVLWSSELPVHHPFVADRTAYFLTHPPDFTTDLRGISVTREPERFEAVFIRSNKRRLVTAADAQTGNVLWQREFKQPPVVRPTVSGDVLVIVTEDRAVHGIAIPARP